MGIVKEFTSGFSQGLAGTSSPIVAAKGLDFTTGSTGLGMNLFGTGSPSRGSVELLSAYRNSPHIRKVVSLIANRLATTDFYLEKGVAGASRSKALRKAKSGKLRNKAANNVTEDIWDHPFLDFLDAGNPLMPGPTGWKLSWIYYLLKGEFFWLLVPMPDGSVGWMVIPPAWVQKIPDTSSSKFVISWGTSSKTVDPEFVFWVRDPDVVSPYGRGSGTGDSLRDEIDTDEYAANLLRTVSANKGLMAGVMSIEGASQDVLAMARQDFEGQHRGFANAGKTMFVDGSAVKYQPLSQSMSELRLLELRDAEKAIIEETFGVPPELFGKVSGSNRATITQAETIFARTRLLPNINQVCLELNLRVLPLFDKRSEYTLDYESPVPEDLDRALELIRIAPQDFTANEIREAAGLETKAWGDVRHQPAMLIEVPAPEGIGRKALAAEATKAAKTTKAAPALTATNITQQQIDQILALYSPEELAERLGPTWRKRMTDIVSEELEALGVPGAFDNVNPLIEAHLQEFGGSRLTVPIGTSRATMAAQIGTGVENLESIGQIARRLIAAGVTDEGYRSRLIARTEVVHSANVARLASWKESGLPGLQKTWLSSLSDTTRGSHSALHNESVGLDKDFHFSGALDPFIGEDIPIPGASSHAAHACNCTCTTVATDVEHDKSLSTYGSEFHVNKMAAFDRQRKQWETDAQDTISKWYAETLDKALAILGLSRSDLT